MHTTSADPESTVAALVETITGTLNPLHNAIDRDKLAALSASMIERGWQGAPLVADGENAITGSHRIAAAAHALNTEGIQIPLPVVQVTELCARYGIDWDTHNAACVDFYEAACRVRDLLPREVADYLGMDAGGL